MIQVDSIHSASDLVGGRSRSGDPAIRLETDALAAEVSMPESEYQERR